MEERRSLHRLLERNWELSSRSFHEHERSTSLLDFVVVVAVVYADVVERKIEKEVGNDDDDDQVEEDLSLHNHNSQTMDRRWVLV